MVLTVAAAAIFSELDVAASFWLAVPVAVESSPVGELTRGGILNDYGIPRPEHCELPDETLRLLVPNASVSQKSSYSPKTHELHDGTQLDLTKYWKESTTLLLQARAQRALM